MAKRRQRDRRMGNRRENRHERRRQQHAGGGEWDCIRIPEGLEVFKPEAEKTYHIDVIPYKVGDHNKNADPGDEYFELSYPVYSSLGIEEKKFIAIGELLGVRDPVVEHFAKLKRDGAEWEERKEFRHKWRQLMLFFVHEEAEKGLQLFEGAYGTFGERLDKDLKRRGEVEHIDNFDDLEGGSTLVVWFESKNIGQKNPWVLADSIDFEKREDGFDAGGDDKLAEEIIEKAKEICLDDLLKVPTYEVLKDALEGVPAGADDEPPEEEDRTERRSRRRQPKDKDDEPPSNDENPDEPEPEGKGEGKRKQPTAADLGIEKGAEVDHDDFGRCVVIRVAKDGLTVTIMDDNDEVHKDIDPTDLEPVNDEPQKESGRGTSKKDNAKPAGKTSPSKDEKKKDDWDEDWEDTDKAFGHVLDTY